MAEEIKITIVSGDQNDTALVEQLGETKEETLKTKKITESKKKSKESDKMLLGKSVFLNQTANKALNLIKETVDLQLNRYITLKEDYRLNSEINNAKTVLSKAFGISAAVGAGFTIGGPAGAAIGAVSYLTTSVIGDVGKYSQIRQGINANNYNMQFQQTRMNLIDNGKGTEN